MSFRCEHGVNTGDNIRCLKCKPFTEEEVRERIEKAVIERIPQPTLAEVKAELDCMEMWASGQFMVLPESQQGQRIDALRRAVVRLEQERAQAVRDANMAEPSCHSKAVERGQMRFTLIEQAATAVKTIAHWIYLNIETASPEKLRQALEECLEMRKFPGRKMPS